MLLLSLLSCSEALTLNFILGRIYLSGAAVLYHLCRWAVNCFFALSCSVMVGAEGGSQRRAVRL